MAALLPAWTLVVEARGDVGPDPLFPEEAAQVAKAVERRRLEFARGRSCARRAMASLAVSPVSILADVNRAPMWPAGVIGSITHTKDYCAAAVARAEPGVSIGIDAEVLRHLEPGVIEKIVSRSEQHQLSTLDPAVAWSCVVFSIKEAIYKASFPLDHRWLDFLDVEVHLDVARGEFSASEVANPTRTFAGRFLLEAELVLAALTL